MSAGRHQPGSVQRCGAIHFRPWHLVPLLTHACPGFPRTSCGRHGTESGSPAPPAAATSPVCSWNEIPVRILRASGRSHAERSACPGIAGNSGSIPSHNPPGTGYVGAGHS